MNEPSRNLTGENRKIRILLVDDSQIILDGLTFNLMFNDHVEICGKALSGLEALNMIKSAIPDLVLLDISLQEESDGIDLLKQIHSGYPRIRVIVFSQKKDVSSIVSAICNGARAFLSKDSGMDEIIQTIYGVMNGNGIFLGETIPESTLKQCFTGKPEKQNFSCFNLSERELSIISWLAKGYISKEIAELEHLQVSTIETHKENIKAKLGLKSIIEVVVFAVQNKLIPLTV